MANLREYENELVSEAQWTREILCGLGGHVGLVSQQLSKKVALLSKTSN